MNPKVESVMKSLRRILLLALLALGIGAVFILLIHENPLEAYAALFKGAFVGKLKIGTTLANFTPLLLTSIAFAVAAIAAVIAVIWMLNKTTLGYKIRTVGTNPANAEYVGINPKKVFIRTMMLSGAIGGLAGCIEVLGTYGYFLNNFATNLGTNGMLASLIVKNNVVTTPFIAFFLAVLRSGALGMQQNTGVPKSIVDTITAIFIIVATMELLFQFNKKRKAKADAQ